MGPAIGGMVYGFLGIVPAYSLVLGLYSVSFFVLLFIKIGKHEVIETAEGVFSRIRSGISFVFQTPELLGAFTLDMFAVLFGGAVAMLPVFASDILFIGPQGLGLLRACPAIGATLMADGSYVPASGKGYRESAFYFGSGFWPLHDWFRPFKKLSCYQACC